MNRAKSVILIYLILVLVCDVYAQSIVVYDQQTGSPVSDVVLFNEDKSVIELTNKKGTANIDEFEEKEVINFQHPSYITISFKKSTIEGLKYQLP